MSGRKLARRACDGCKIRKIKCNEATPCEGCVNAKIPCTWLKQSQPRGPRRLRDATLQEIRKAQDILRTQSQIRRGTTRSLNVNDPDPPPEPSSEIAHLVLYLCVYRVQLYPIWPIIKVERLIASLQSENPDIEVFALAYALAAATATRTGSTELNISRRNHAQILEGKCQAARAKVPQGRRPNLNTVRITYFLYIYHESLEANSMKSMLYLREAVTIATMIGLHKEVYYTEVPAQEREIRRRVLWLLFVTERTVSVLYENTPTTLRTKIELPSTTDTDELDILAGFQNLVRLFWTLDEKGMFNVLDELDIQASPSSYVHSPIASARNDFADAVETGLPYSRYVPPVQALDLAVTRCWLHVMNLRIQQAANVSSGGSALRSLIVAVERVAVTMEKCSYSLIEAHGFWLVGISDVYSCRSPPDIFNRLKKKKTNVVQQLKLSVISGAMQELLATSPVLREEVGLRETCKTLFMRVTSAFLDKTGGNIVQGTTMPLFMVPNMSDGTVSLAPSRGDPEKPAAGDNSLSPDRPVWPEDDDSIPLSATTMPPYLKQDFAASHNYEGLFDAVQLAGVQSSDSVEDLFSHTSLEHYDNFDNGWPQRPEGVGGSTLNEQPPPRFLFDFG